MDLVAVNFSVICIVKFGLICKLEFVPDAKLFKGCLVSLDVLECLLFFVLIVE